VFKVFALVEFAFLSVTAAGVTTITLEDSEVLDIAPVAFSGPVTPIRDLVFFLVVVV
jgi:hypothetical protein